jgi:hypothetical protein
MPKPMKQKIYLLLVLFSFIAINKASCQKDIHHAKAVYIYNFLSHIMLQNTEQSNKIIIGVLGKTKTYDYLLNYTAERNVGSKEIDVIRIQNANHYQQCQVILIAESSSNLLKGIEQSIGDNSCLIIGEKPGITQMGAAIEFIQKNNKLSYKLNKTNAEKHNVIVSKSLEYMSK